MTQAFNLSQLANKVNSSGQLDGATGLTGTITSSALSITGNSNLATSSGNVGIGTSSPNTKLHVSSGAVTITGSSSTTARINMFNNAATTAGLLLGQGYASGTDNIGYIFNVANAPVVFGTNDVERWRIDASGILSSRSAVSSGNFPFIIGTSGGYPVDRGLNINTSASSAIPIYFTVSSGAFAPGFISCTTTTTTYSTSSDYRLKENIETMTGALNTVCELNPVTYTWKSNGSNGQGFIAHELQAIVPDAVTGEKDAIDSEGKPQYQGVDSSFLVAILTKAIQEQQIIINDLKARIETLELK